MPEETPYDAFLNYSSRDTEVVEALARRLMEEAGLSVWLDTWNQLTDGYQMFSRWPDED